MKKIHVLLSLLLVVALVGCASVNTLSGATKAVAAGYTTVGVAVAAQVTCDQTAVALAEQGKLDTAKATLQICVDLNKAEHLAISAINAAKVALAAIGPNGTGYAAAVAPMQTALCQLNKAINVVDPSAPVVLCADQNGG